MEVIIENKKYEENKKKTKNMDKNKEKMMKITDENKKNKNKK